MHGLFIWSMILLALLLEISVRTYKIHDTFDKAYDCRNTCPAENKVKNSHTDLSAVEFVGTYATKENAENAGNKLTFHNQSI